MLGVSISELKNEREGQVEEGGLSEWDFSGSNLLDSIDFDDLFLGGGDVLPDLEMHPSSVDNNNILLDNDDQSVPSVSLDQLQQNTLNNNYDDVVSVVSSSPLIQINTETKPPVPPPPPPHHSKNPHGKRKVKVDWTPELHRRFVEAVEQLGVDKAVPSRILELMGVHCLTRHNIASHLQKYRSHRKHVVVREAEAATWKRHPPPPHPQYLNNPNWSSSAPVPTMGFPPPMPVPHHHHQLIRPSLHVWGHPSLDQSFMPIWPKHLINPPHPNWPPPDPAASFWISHPHQVPTPGTPCFPPRLPPARFPTTPPVPGIPPPPPGLLGFPTPQTLPKPPSDVHPSKESVDAAIGDALSKPWSPLPLGLKPPSVDGVMVELQRQGISKVPPSCA